MGPPPRYMEGSGGGGGGLAYGAFPVTPGSTITVVVGEGGIGNSNTYPSNGHGGDGGESYISYGGNYLLRGYGGKGGIYSSNIAAMGGGYYVNTLIVSNSGGGDGGYGSNCNDGVTTGWGGTYATGGNGGGAGGYGSRGGHGVTVKEFNYGSVDYSNNASSNGGGGGGFNLFTQNSTELREGGCGGGGVGLLGEGTFSGISGGGGSGGKTGKSRYIPRGGPGGGGAGGREIEDWYDIYGLDNFFSNVPGSNGGQGGVRIIWGSGREYPNKNDDIFDANTYLLTTTYKNQLKNWGYPPYSCLYKASIHGFTNRTFHYFADGITHDTIVVIKTENGHIFGGTTCEPWGENTRRLSGAPNYLTSTEILTYGEYRNSSNTNPVSTPFVFNLYGNSSAPIKWDLTDASKTIYSNVHYGPTFGSGHDIYVDLDTKTVSENDSSYGSGGGNTGRVTGYTNSGTNRIVELEFWNCLILTDSYQSQLSTWGYTPDELVYKASQHGYSNGAFHDLCDNLSESIVVLKCVNGYVCGGIAATSWGGYTLGNIQTIQYVTWPNTDPFIFNLRGNTNAPIKYNLTANSNHIARQWARGPMFSGTYGGNNSTIWIDINHRTVTAPTTICGMPGGRDTGSLLDIEVWSIA